MKITLNLQISKENRFISKSNRIKATLFQSQRWYILFFTLISFSGIFGFTLDVNGEIEGSVEITLTDLGSEKISTGKITIEVYQDHGELPILKVDKIKDNPHTIDSLPIGHSYKFLIYRNSVYASYGVIDLDRNLEQIEIKLSGNARVITTIYYSDGISPVQGATVLIKSQDGKEWEKLLTDKNGKTDRQSLQPVISKSDYYYMEIFLIEDVSFTTNHLTFSPGASDIKIITPWPSIIDKLIKVKINSQNPSSNQFKNMLVTLEDQYGGEWDSPVDSRGLSYFSLIPTNQYKINVFKISTLDKSRFLVTTESIFLDGKRDFFIIPVDLRDEDFILANLGNESKGIKELTKKWEKNELNDIEFFREFLWKSNNKNIKEIPPAASKLSYPYWVKKNALWFLEDKISEKTFVNGINFLIKKGIISAF
jgi:hypothetical protein